ncbi:plasmid partitioning protein RepB [Roseivivax halodurans]|nr:plasmid partitioning protein RepB [Roseivivax halodurans]
MKKRRSRLAGLEDALTADSHNQEAPSSEETPASKKPHFTKSLEVFDKDLSSRMAELERLKKQAPREIGTDQVSDSRFSDRIDVRDDLAGLVDSIKQDGQRLPILVRTKTSGPLPYEVVYGRRRLAACRELGRPVLAIIADMDEAEAVLLQGVENAERLETSYIERASFAHQLRQAGYDGRDIERVLGKDAPEISRMKSLMETLPDGLVQALGPVKDGRRPFEGLQKAIAQSKLDGQEIIQLVDRDLPVGRRVNALTTAVGSAGRSDAPAKKPTAESVAGKITATRSGNGLVVKAAAKEEAEFLDFVRDRLPDMYDQWKEAKS